MPRPGDHFSMTTRAIPIALALAIAFFELQR